MAGVATKHKLYEELEDRWARCRHVTGGSDVVKAQGVKYLPLLDSHKRDIGKYEAYKLRALFYNATGRTVAGLSGGIFQKAPAVTIEGPVVEQMQEHMKDVTLTDEPLDMFALKVTREHLITGRYGILVDMANEDQTTPRPYWVGYAAEDIINWRYKKLGGDQELVLVVLREVEESIDEKDEFAAKPRIQYRVLRLSDDGVYTQQIYIEDTATNQEGTVEKKFIAGEVITPKRRGVALDFIPFALPWTLPIPPLLDLVEVNLSHYRGSADLKHGLHMTALPTPWVSGRTAANQNTPLQIGSGTAWDLDKEGSAGMLEFTGKGLGAIRTDLLDMQSMMATLGARLLQEPPRYAETALSVSMRHASDYATLRTIAQVVEQQISWAIKIHQWWLSTEKQVLNIKSGIELNKVFHDQSITADELRAMLLALQSNSISYKTFYARLSNTGWMREGVTAEEEMEEIQDQPTELGIPPALTDSALLAGHMKSNGKKPEGQAPEGTGEKLRTSRATKQRR